MSAEVERKIEVTYLDLDTIHPNAWNPNAMGDRTYEAARESIRTFGFLVPMIVRSDPEIEGQWQIIDGEHRWKAAQDEGATRGPAIIVDGFSDPEVKKLTLALNMHGDADVVPLGKLLAELSLSMSTLDELRMALPYGDSELEELVKIGQIEWGSFGGDGQAEVEAFLEERAAAQDGKTLVTLGFDEAQIERYKTFIEMLAREGGDTFTPEEAVLTALSSACQSL